MSGVAGSPMACQLSEMTGVAGKVPFNIAVLHCLLVLYAVESLAATIAVKHGPLAAALLE